MHRVFLRTIMLTALLFIGSLPSSAQDPEKKTQEKKKPAKPDAYTQVKDAGPDYAIQGEYEMELKEGGTLEKMGLQLISKGDGKFEGRILRGGLPGAGWNAKDEFPLKVTLVDGKGAINAKIKGKDETIGEIDSGKIIVKDHDGAGITPKKVERKSPTEGAKPPEGAIVLFDKPEDADKWAGGKVIELPDGKFLNNGIKTKQKFKNFKLHVEFRLAFMPKAGGQGRSNSGVYLQDRYEVQVLDSFGLKGLNNECGGIYTIAAPKVNMCFPPLQWQTYDIDFTAAEFDKEGKKTKNAVATVLHNGVLVQDKQEIPHETGGGQKEGDTPGPIQLQNHGDPVYFRNIWIVEQK